jgi:hypothetical protein
MFENQPDLVREYLDSNNLAELEKLLDRKVQSALSLVLRLKKDGLSEDEAFQAAAEAILAPSDGPAFSDNPPDPLPYEDQRKVYARLEARELGNRKAEERRSKMHLT